MLNRRNLYSSWIANLCLQFSGFVSTPPCVSACVCLIFLGSRKKRVSSRVWNSDHIICYYIHKAFFLFNVYGNNRGWRHTLLIMMTNHTFERNSSDIWLQVKNTTTEVALRLAWKTAQIFRCFEYIGKHKIKGRAEIKLTLCSRKCTYLKFGKKNSSAHALSALDGRPRTRHKFVALAEGYTSCAVAVISLHPVLPKRTEKDFNKREWSTFSRRAIFSTALSIHRKSGGLEERKWAGNIALTKPSEEKWRHKSSLPSHQTPNPFAVKSEVGEKVSSETVVRKSGDEWVAQKILKVKCLNIPCECYVI